MLHNVARPRGGRSRWVMSTINWKLIAFIGVLWWLIYSAPTEDSIFTMFVHKAGGSSASADDF